MRESLWDFGEEGCSFAALIVGLVLEEDRGLINGKGLMGFNGLVEEI